MSCAIGLLEFTTIFINNRKINERYGNYGIVEFINVVIIFFSYGYIRVYYLAKICFYFIFPFAYEIIL